MQDLERVFKPCEKIYSGETTVPGLSDFENIPSLTYKERLILADTIKSSTKEFNAAVKKQKEIVRLIRIKKDENMRDKPMLPVKNKKNFYERFYKGEFGNHGPMWETLEEWKESKYPGPIAIRTLVQGGRCDYNIPAKEVIKRTKSFNSQNYYKLNYSAMAPEEKSLVKGEVSNNNFFLSYEKLPMRAALEKSGFHCQGLRGRLILKHFMDTASFEQLEYLSENYVDHVIEFSTYSVPWGVLNLNTVFWEIRKY